MLYLSKIGNIGFPSGLGSWTQGVAGAGSVAERRMASTLAGEEKRGCDTRPAAPRLGGRISNCNLCCFSKTFQDFSIRRLTNYVSNFHRARIYILFRWVFLKQKLAMNKSTITSTHHTFNEFLSLIRIFNYQLDHRCLMMTLQWGIFIEHDPKTFRSKIEDCHFRI